MTRSPADVSADIRRQARDALRHRRDTTLRLLAPLSRAEVHDQVHDYLSPLVWDVGHVGNFEELWLLRQLDGRQAHDLGLDELYNAFENPRWTRGQLPILTAQEALPYLDHVRRDALTLLDSAEVHPEADSLTADAYVHRMIVQHEGQHQETILQSLDLRDELSAWDLGRKVPSSVHVDDRARVRVPAGDFQIGTDERRWTYDNERPGHVRDIPAFDLDTHPVTNRRWANFIADGGYDQSEHFSERGWQWRVEQGITAPQGWLPMDQGWRVRRFGRVIEMDPREPVQHVSFFEAEAFASWAGGRLPTEFEWEKAAAWDPATDGSRRYPWGDAPPDASRANVDIRRFSPLPVGSLPAGASAVGAQQMAGDVYQWTSSPFTPWPGFQAFPYPEYSEVFFDGDYQVLRGSSWAIAWPMARCTYRNWDHPYRRQIFAGVRVAWASGDVAPTREDA